MTDDYSPEGLNQMSKKKRGLGRGLDALFENDEGVYPQADPDGHTPGKQRKTVGVGQLEPNLRQPRKKFDETALAELTESIKKHGILQPLLVRTKEGFPDMYQIVAGERRWRAAQLAQIHEIPVVVSDYDDETVLEVALVENLQREDLNPLEEAEGYRRLVDQFGHTQEEIAKVVSKSRSHVANTLRLLNLPESIQALLSSGQLTSGHARALLSSEDPEALAQEILSKGLNVRETETLASGAPDKDPGKKSSGKKTPKKDTDTLALENEVSSALGMKVEINMKSQSAGAISIAFDTLDQLDEVLHRLSHAPTGRHES